MGDVGIPCFYQHSSNVLLSSLLSVQSLQELLYLFCSEGNFYVGKCLRIIYELLLIFVEMLLQLLVGIYVGDALKHPLDRFICAATRLELYQ